MIFNNNSRRKAGLKLLAVMVSLGLAGCASTPNFSATPDQYKTVAVVSLIPRTITMSHIGVTVFNNDEAVFPLDWDPNALATQTAITLLSQNHKITDLAVNADAILAAVGRDHTPMHMGVTENLVRAQLKAIVPPGKVNLIVVIDASLPGTTFITFGPDTAGLVSESQIAATSIGNDHVGLIATVEVIDGTTFQVIGRGFAKSPDLEDTLLYGPEAYSPDFIMDNLGWRGKPYNELTPSQQQTLKTAEQQAIQDFVTDALADAHLTGG